ncbi:hypothetical protein LINPERHAP1_LOCUS1828, partial [Linum perenne]
QNQYNLKKINKIFDLPTKESSRQTKNEIATLLKHLQTNKVEKTKNPTLSKQIISSNEISIGQVKLKKMKMRIMLYGYI